MFPFLLVNFVKNDCENLRKVLKRFRGLFLLLLLINKIIKIPQRHKNQSAQTICSHTFSKSMKNKSIEALFNTSYNFTVFTSNFVFLYKNNCCGVKLRAFRHVLPSIRFLRVCLFVCLFVCQSPHLSIACSITLIWTVFDYVVINTL